MSGFAEDFRAGRFRAPDFVIGSADRPYLRRWWLIPRNPVFNVYLHQILRSDDDRALHDHPWWNVSVILDGEYVEHTIAAGGIHGRRLRKRGDVVLRQARQAHRLEIAGDPCWSLFITGPKLREWGFHCPEEGWIPWRRFVTPGEPGEIGDGCAG